MAIKLANIAMPTTMSARALRYKFTPSEIIGRNGKGEAIVSNNGASKEDSTSSGTIVYNHKRAEQTFNHCMILRPEYKILRGTEYVEVTLLIDQLW